MSHRRRVSVLFVCAGNTCRSPMAAAFMRSARPDVHVSSAGLHVVSWDSASQEAIIEMARRGLDLASHRARKLTAEAALAPAAVACMQRSHMTAVRQLAPGANVKTLGEWAGSPGDVVDPFGRGPKAYAECAVQLEELVARWVVRLRDSAGTDHRG